MTYVEQIPPPAAHKATAQDYREAATITRRPTVEEIQCQHEWNGPYQAGIVRYCVKCGGKQTN